MGTPVRVRPPPTPGPDCLICTPDHWPSGATPHIIRIIARGMTDWPGDPPQPNSIPVHAANTDGDPCLWSATLSVGAGTYDYWYWACDGDGYSQIGINRTDPNPRPLFESYLDHCEIGPFINQATHPDSSPVGGSAYALDFPLSIVIKIAETYNFQPDPLALYDLSESATPDHVILRLTGRTNPGSCLFKVDTTAL